MENRRLAGIGYLKREQLQYELKVRGCEEGGSVPELAARLRSAASVPVNISQEVIGEVGAVISNVSGAVLELGKIVEFLQDRGTTNRQLIWVQAQLNHFHNRVWDLQRLSDSAPPLLRGLQKLALEKVKGEFQGLVMSVNSLGAHEVELDDVNRKINLGGERDTRADVRDVGLDHCERVFAKLPHPLSLLLKEVGTLSIDNIKLTEEVLWLLVRFERHADALNVSHIVILELLYPLAKGFLGEVIAEVLSSRGNLAVLRRRIITEKIPMRVRRELERTHIWQAQETHEGLTHYVNRVRTAVVALEVNLTEPEVVDIILEGIRPEDRARIMFKEKPRTFEQLNRLVSSIESLQLVDEQRRADMTPRLHDANLPVEGQRTGGGRPRARCYRCGSDEHLIRQCPIEGSPRRRR